MALFDPELKSEPVDSQNEMLARDKASATRL